MFLNPASYLQLVWSPTTTAQSGAWGLPLLGAGFLYSILSPTDWISCVLSYIIVQHPPSSCGHHHLALIQPVHGQGHNILIFLDRMHQLFTQVHFLFWQPSQVIGQYTTLTLALMVLKYLVWAAVPFFKCPVGSHDLAIVFISSFIHYFLSPYLVFFLIKFNSVK